MLVYTLDLFLYKKFKKNTDCFIIILATLEVQSTHQVQQFQRSKVRLVRL